MTPRIFWVFFVGPEQFARFAVAFLRGTRDKSPDGSFTRSPIKKSKAARQSQETPIEISVFFYAEQPRWQILPIIPLLWRGGPRSGGEGKKA